MFASALRPILLPTCLLLAWGCATKPDNLYISEYFDPAHLGRGGLFLAGVELAPDLGKYAPREPAPADGMPPTPMDTDRWLGILGTRIQDKVDGLKVDSFRSRPDIIPEALRNSMISEFRAKHALSPATMESLRKAMDEKHLFIRYWAFLMVGQDYWQQHQNSTDREDREEYTDPNTKQKQLRIKRIRVDQYFSERTMESELLIFDLHYKEITWRGGAKDTARAENSIEVPLSNNFGRNLGNEITAHMFRGTYPPYPEREQVLALSFNRYASFLPQEKVHHWWWPF